MFVKENPDRKNKNQVNLAFEYNLGKYQNYSFEKMKGSKFSVDYVDQACFVYHKININRRALYMKYKKRVQDKNATIISQNEDEECFKYGCSKKCLIKPYTLFYCSNSK